MSLECYASRGRLLGVVLVCSLNLSCGDTPSITTRIPIASLPASFGTCLNEISQLERRRPTACFYIEGAEHVLEIPLNSACSATECDLGAWPRGAPDELTANDGTVSFANPATLEGDLPSRLVLVASGPCPAPSRQNFTSSTFVCSGSSFPGSTSSCFASFAISTFLSPRVGIELPSNAQPRFQYSRIFEAEVNRDSVNFDSICSTSSQRISVGDTPIERQLALTLNGSGTGSVNSMDPLFPTCEKTSAAPTTCMYNVLGGSNITLVATPGIETTVNWDAMCTASEPNTCQLNIDNSGSGNIDLTLNLPLNTYRLTLDLLATRNTPAPGQITALMPTVDATGRPVQCGPAPSSCSFNFDFGTVVQLQAQDSAGSGNLAFNQWSAPCPDASNPRCDLTITQNTTVSATFESDLIPITIETAGLGSVVELDRLPGEPAIRCGDIFPREERSCSRLAREGDTIRLSATPRAQTGETFRAFEARMGQITPCQNSEAAECLFTLGATRVDLRAIFMEPLTIGQFIGEGSVVSNPSGINCQTARQGTCAHPFDFGTQVTLTATPEPTSNFVEWSITATITDTNSALTLPISRPQTLDAIFGHTLTLNVIDDGLIQLEPDGQQCDSQQSPCRYIFRDGTRPNLTANPRIGSGFMSWSGLETCTTESTCAVPMNENRNISASFGYRLAGQVTNSIGGRLTGGGLNCRRNGDPGCLALVNSGQNLSIVAEPDPNFTLGPWAGNCAGTQTNTCNLDINGPQSPRADYQVTMTFNGQQPLATLTVDAVGAPGDIRVTLPDSSVQICSSPNTCRYNVVQNTNITLQGAPTQGGQFVGFEGGNCSGTGSCTVNVGTGIAVTGTFHEVLRVFFNSLNSPMISSSRVVSQTPTGIDVTADGVGTREISVLPGATVRLEAIPQTLPAPGVDFDGWFNSSQALISANSVQDFVLNRGVGVLEVHAAFNIAWQITVTINDGYPGRVTTPGLTTGGLSNCNQDRGAPCTLRLPRSTGSVRLRAVPSSMGTRDGGDGWSIEQWENDCSAVEDMNGIQRSDCIINFDLNDRIKEPRVQFQYPVSFAGNIMNVLNASCISCHEEGDENGLTIDVNSIANTYDRIVCPDDNCATTLCCSSFTPSERTCTGPQPSGGTGPGRINANIPENSIILQMPLDSGPSDPCTNHVVARPWTPTNTDYLMFRDWIRAGAPLN